jgi:hypothetical protein
MFTLLSGGEWAWQEGKSGLKENVNSCFPSSLKKKEGGNPRKASIKRIYVKYPEVFLNVFIL